MVETKCYKLRIGEQLEWEYGALLCIKKKNGKFRLSVKNPKSIVKNDNNKEIFKNEYEYVSIPEKYVSIVRTINGESRLMDLLNGIYLTKNTVYVEEYMGDNLYLVKDLLSSKKVIWELKRKLR